MEGERKRIRRDYEPLTVSVSLVVETGNSPATQVYDAATEEYDPDRGMTPMIIRPIVTARATDGSWPHESANEFIGEAQWLVNGVNIETLEEWNSQYSVVATGSGKGTLTVKKNLAPSEQVSLVYKGVIADARLGVNVPFISDAIVLSTFDKGWASYSVSIGDSQIIQYNPFKDKRFRYEYQKAHGISTTDSEAVANADVNSYIRKVPVTVYDGEEVMKTGYEVKYFHLDTETSATTEVKETDDEVIEMNTSGITLDLRMLERGDYMVLVEVGGKEAARTQFSVNRVYPSFTLVPANGTAINPNDMWYYNVIMVNSDGKKVINPESIIKINWYTDTATRLKVPHNEGATTLIRLSDTGIGDKWPDDWMDIYVEGEQKVPHAVATDGDDNEYEDESGNTLIFN